MRDHTTKALSAARRLRREMSLPEVMLWQYLRGRPAGLKFRRQHPVGPFVADFYCAARRLVIEIDGIAHDMGDRPEADARRDEWLRGRGLEVVRIPADDVLRDTAAVAGAIVTRCLGSPPPSGASRLPPPPVGEEHS